MSILRLTNFATTPTAMVLHDGASYFSQTWLGETAEARIRIRQLSNGVLHDLDATSQAVLIPQPFSSIVLVKLASRAAVIAKWDEWKVNAGKRAVLTGQDPVGATETCTARLRQIKRLDASKLVIQNKLKVELFFVPINNWT
jgi:hypothetical protein